MAEVAQYAALLDLGRPDFIEIKGVTYCGSSDASSLTMGNVPYHEVGERGGGLNWGWRGLVARVWVCQMVGLVGAWNLRAVACAQGDQPPPTHTVHTHTPHALTPQDVKEFGEAICLARGGEYGLACEHEHSCCILLANRERFLRDGRCAAAPPARRALPAARRQLRRCQPASQSALRNSPGLRLRCLAPHHLVVLAWQPP
jgi:tRNA wybutosine-synthesizing protein 1